MSAAHWRECSSGPLAMLLLTFPGVFLPLDLIFAGPGFIAYATGEQAARIVLYSAAVAFVLSAVALLLVAWLPSRRRVALVLSLTLTALALLHGALLWTQYFSYS